MEKSSEASDSDRICNLPQPLLHHILSFLPTLYVIQTCVLSKYWRNIWWSLPTLNFQDDLFKDFDSFAKFVDAALLFRDGSNVTKLSVSSTVTGSSGSKVNGWILYAMRHNIQVLDMTIFGDDSNDQLFLRTFNCESLRKMKLCRQVINIPSLVCLPALRILHITDSVINTELLTNLCSSSSFLESLILEQCIVRGSTLTISSSHLRYLKMSGHGAIHTDFMISSPNLTSLYLLNMSQRLCVLRSNHFLLADAFIKHSMYTVESVIQLTSKAKNVQTLFIHLSLYTRRRRSTLPVAFQPKDISILNNHQLSFCNLKWFGVLTWFTNVELAVINNILKCSPQIESILFICKGGRVDSNCEVEKIWSKYNLYHLKYVEIQGFTGIDNEVKMVKFLLGNAVVLKKMIIRYSKDLDKEDRQKMHKIAESLLSCPRASPSVGILFVQDM